jgi:hypothetical protein
MLLRAGLCPVGSRARGKGDDCKLAFTDAGARVWNHKPDAAAAKGDAKADSKAESKAESKADTKAEAKADTKSDAKAAVTASSGSAAGSEKPASSAGAGSAAAASTSASSVRAASPARSAGAGGTAAGSAGAGAAAAAAMHTETVRYANGPLFDLALARENPPGDAGEIEVWCTFATDFFKPGGAEGLMPGTPAIVAGSYGKGRVVAISPHPEKSNPAMTPNFQNIFLWLARKI